MHANLPGMAGYGIAQWIVAAVAVAVVVYPIGRILRRMGFSPLLSIVALFPFLNILALWIVAFIDWPEAARTAE
jgi:ATP/ADP translocase